MIKIFVSTAFTNLLIAGINFTSGILVARMLTPEDRGLLASIMFFLPIITILFTFGIQESTTYLVSKYRNNNKLISTTSIILAHKLGILSVIISLVFQTIYFSTLSSLLYLGAIIFSLQSFVSLCSTVMLACDLGNYNFKNYNNTRLVSYLFYLTGIIFLFFVDFINLDLKIFLLIILNFLFIVVLYLQRLKIFWSVLQKYRPNKKIEKKLIFMGLKFHTSNVVLFINKQFDKYIIMTFFSLNVFGLYLIAWNFLYVITNLVSGTLTTIAMPYLSRSKDFYNDSFKYLFYSSLLSLITVLIIGFISYNFISLIYGIKYIESESLAAYLMLAVYISVIKEILFKIFKSHKIYDIPLKSELLFLTIFIIMIFGLKLFFGFNNIYNFIFIFSLSLVVSFFYLIINFYLLRRSLNVEYN